MDKQCLEKFIDVVLNTDVKSQQSQGVEALKLYQTFCWTLNDRWKVKYNKFFAVAKKTTPEKWGDSLPDDGFFIHLLYGVLYTMELGNHDESCKDAQQSQYIENLTTRKKSLDACLANIKKEYCCKPVKIKKDSSDDLHDNTSNA